MCEDYVSGSVIMLLVVIHFSGRVEVSWGLFIQVARKPFGFQEVDFFLR